MIILSGLTFMNSSVSTPTHCELNMRLISEAKTRFGGLLCGLLCGLVCGLLCGLVVGMYMQQVPTAVCKKYPVYKEEASTGR